MRTFSVFLDALRRESTFRSLILNPVRSELAESQLEGEVTK